MSLTKIDMKYCLLCAVQAIHGKAHETQMSGRVLVEKGRMKDKRSPLSIFFT